MDGQLTQAPSWGVSSSPVLRSTSVCIVAPRRSSAVAPLAARLRDAGHDVTLLPPEELPPSPVPLGGSLALAGSYLVYRRLLQHSFDAVSHPENAADGL